MAIIPTQNQYPDRAGYLGLDTDRNVLSVMSDGKMKSTSIPEGWTNVKDFGAKGDGITDDTQAIQNALNYSFTNLKKTIYFPDGTYLVSSPFDISNYQYYAFIGNYSTILSTNTKIFIGENIYFTTFQNLILMFDEYRPENIAFDFTQFGRLSAFKNIQIRLADIAFSFNSGWYILFENIHLVHTKIGIKSIGDNTNFLVNNFFSENGNALLDIQGLNSSSFNNISIDWSNHGLSSPYSFKEFLPENALPTIRIGSCRNINFSNIALERCNIDSLIHFFTGNVNILFDKIRLVFVEFTTSNRYLIRTPTEYTGAKFNNIYFNQCFTTQALDALILFGYSPAAYGSKPDIFPFIVLDDNIKTPGNKPYFYQDNVVRNAPLAIHYRNNHPISRLTDFSSLTDGTYTDVFFKLNLDSTGTATYSPVTYYHRIA